MKYKQHKSCKMLFFRVFFSATDSGSEGYPCLRHSQHPLQPPDPAEPRAPPQTGTSLRVETQGGPGSPAFPRPQGQRRRH